MKKSELRKIIKEEIQSIIQMNESPNTGDRFRVVKDIVLIPDGYEDSYLPLDTLRMIKRGTILTYYFTPEDGIAGYENDEDGSEVLIHPSAEYTISDYLEPIQ